MANYEDILNKSAFHGLEPERKEALRELMRRLDGKNTIETMGIIMDFSKNMPKGREINKDEQSAMMHAILENMDNSDKQKFSAVIKMMEMMNR